MCNVVILILLSATPLVPWPVMTLHYFCGEESFVRAHQLPNMSQLDTAARGAIILHRTTVRKANKYAQACS